MFISEYLYHNDSAFRCTKLSHPPNPKDIFLLFMLTMFSLHVALAFLLHDPGQLARAALVWSRLCAHTGQQTGRGISGQGKLVAGFREGKGKVGGRRKKD